MYSIAEVAEKFDISKNTLRYYERIGLLDLIGRDSKGIRFYTDDNLDEINKIVHLRKVGASISEIRIFLSDEKKPTIETLQNRIQFLKHLNQKLAKEMIEINEQKDYIDKKLNQLVKTMDSPES
ncbi:MerR family transcriptional regulator [Enterococcus dongliensis]|uniref:MerR family transcriptional regulator n=2 Tax=Enterococcus dongliensis TaxID=2559925 RepID=A0AAW8TMJ7_9ENTE|nr:MerR family transcriptional regulator [Enterococcus dongliensis]MDT2634791.1 MerR family transcriptional regulator [Enterococcus dongliensis]MDT2638439.1 MerR family transcriptional regulator [Enterococcus dongliensis]MDT2670316.1 MerR family transcriptional regulator [Enterococcus dongliensis]MDT2671568.1 MerR family transcriptional regulator [Enterococcus dongliensis]